jgi:membrane protease YdiL (CAAX protease family)
VSGGCVCARASRDPGDVGYKDRPRVQSAPPHGPWPPPSPEGPSRRSPPRRVPGQTTARPSPWPALAAYLVAFLLALVSSTLLVFAVAFVRTGGQRARLQSVAYDFAMSDAGLMAGALVNALVLSVVAFGAARIQGAGVGSRLRLGPTCATPAGTLAAIAGMVGLSFACGAASEALGVRGTGVMDTMAQALHGPSAVRFAEAILAIGVAPGFAEETFFRGYMQTGLTASWGRWPGIVATAAAFGFLHLDPVQGSLAFVAGVFLGWMVDRFGGVRPTILAHVTNNAIFVAFSAFGPTGESSRGAQIALVVGGTSLWIAATAFLRSPRALTPTVRASRRAS